MSPPYSEFASIANPAPIRKTTGRADAGPTRRHFPPATPCAILSAGATQVALGRENPSVGGTVLPHQHSSTTMVGEAQAYVQGESLKVCAAFRLRLLNSPIARTGSDAVDVEVEQVPRSVFRSAFRLRTPGAIIVAAVIVGLSVIGAAVGNRLLEGRYELVVADNNGGLLGWRLNKRTGDVAVCELAPNPFAAPARAKDDPFADAPPLAGSRSRVVDKLMVECGFE
jgi:hypothetical protein